MRHTNSLLALVAMMASLPLAAQQPGMQPPGSQQPVTPATPNTAPAQGPTSGQSTPRAVPVPSTGNAPEISNSQLRPISGELESKLDTKNAKPGDSVVVKTTDKATTASGIVIPKGSKIVGKVTDVAAQGDGTPNAHVTLQFDHAELKGGQNLPIKSVIQSVSPAAGSSGPADAMGGAPSAMPSAGAGTTGGGSPSSGAASTSPQQAAPTASAPSTSAAAGTDQAGGPPAGTIVARNGNVAFRTTSIPGVLLAGNADGQPFSNASGALVGARQNVHLDGGTKVVLAVADMGNGNVR